jgi:hypothetical protein
VIHQLEALRVGSPHRDGALDTLTVGARANGLAGFDWWYRTEECEREFVTAPAT